MLATTFVDVSAQAYTLRRLHGATKPGSVRVRDHPNRGHHSERLQRRGVHRRSIHNDGGMRLLLQDTQHVGRSRGYDEHPSCAHRLSIYPGDDSRDEDTSERRENDTVGMT